jgi:hypothetical protein
MRYVAYLAAAAALSCHVAVAQEPAAACVQTATSCVALNPDVTATSIDQTICVPGFTAHLRPDAGYVSDIKDRLGREGGLGADVAGAMILDHIIPLALGGHPRDPSNLQLQDVAESHRKDRIELKLHCLVCSGQVPLSEAREAIAADWQAAYHRYALVKCHRANRARAAGG